jgi:hypothetical protein
LKKQNELFNDLFNNENNNNNSLLNNKDENKNLNSSKSNQGFIYKGNQTQMLDSQIKKLKDNNKILEYLKSLRKNKTNN